MDNHYMTNKNLVVAAMTILVSGFVVGAYMLGGQAMLAQINYNSAQATPIIFISTP